MEPQQDTTPGMHSVVVDASSPQQYTRRVRRLLAALHKAGTGPDSDYQLTLNINTESVPPRAYLLSALGEVQPFMAVRHLTLNVSLFFHCALRTVRVCYNYCFIPAMNQL